MRDPVSSQPLVSVIMPTYNQGEFIGQAIESVLNQTYKNLELIIIDNYSVDGTEKIISKFNDIMASERLRGITSPLSIQMICGLKKK